MLVIAAGYYILGSKNGLRYAIAAIIPVLADISFDHYLNLDIPSRIVNINYTAYGITVFVNFSLILYIHNLFFKSLNKFKKREVLFKRNLEQAAESLREQAMAKTNFLNTMSHEIRTPLNAIVGMSNLLSSDNKLPEQEENIQILNFSAGNLMATVNDIIDFNNLDNGQIQLQHAPFILFETVANVCATFREQAAMKHLRFECTIDEKLKDRTLNGDQLRLSQILFHLIGNAVKFTTEGFVNVKVAYAADTPQGVLVAFKIEDSGIGISKSKQQQILTPFKKKLPRTQRQYQATIGITVAYQLLKLHGSDLKIMSKEGKGSCFSFDVIYNLANQQKAFNEDPLGPIDVNLSNLRILVVDDERLNLLVVKKTLAKWNVIADEATNGKVALEMCIEKDYDVILMDINMPVMDGFESAKAIKEIKRQNFIPPQIIVLTASIGAAIGEVLKFPYIDDCILKPFKPDELREKLNKLNTPSS
ncbi:response regulator [Mucilaginibacter panaciglaebae]|uniref:histidine kinase n=1 Tax=Mucilaginibacter panaciglaebae TaxID=502331 RepID=A0ABP7X153_9SPHI